MRFTPVRRELGRSSLGMSATAGRGDFPPVAAERSAEKFVGLDVGDRGASLNFYMRVDEVSRVQLSCQRKIRMEKSYRTAALSCNL